MRLEVTNYTASIFETALSLGNFTALVEASVFYALWLIAIRRTTAITKSLFLY